MSIELIAALTALAASLLARRRRLRARLDLDDWALALTLHAGLVGLLATLLAAAGWFGVHGLSLACVGAAVLAWPWTLERERAAPIERPQGLAATLVLLAIVAAGVGLRSPPIPAPLAGRDQGTYVLRAQASMRSGALGWTDEVFARAGRALADEPAPGDFDILGLAPRNDDPWRDDAYEAAYRPGAYLADREAGEVMPQFFHLHPMQLASCGLALGVARMQLASTWLAGLWLLTLACCARRLWPRGPWAALALALVAASPLAIWTGRTPLSETPMAALEWAAVLVGLRLRAGVDHPQRGGLWIAALLGLAAAVRGNALLMLPLVLAITWLRPRVPEHDERGPELLLAGLTASITLHALTCYPYVHDELLRQLPEARLGPSDLVAVAGLAALAWLGVDRLVARLTSARPRLPWAPALARVPLGFALVAVLAAALWWWLEHTAEPGPPFSRLDAAPILLGLPWLAAAGLGLVLGAWRWRPQPREFWLLGLAAVVPATLLLYAQRQLPTLGFFYYGRYLVPELLPLAALAAAHGLERSFAWLAGPHRELDETRRSVGQSARLYSAELLAVAAGFALLWSVAGPLLAHPQLRLREYEPADEAIDALAAQLEPGAVVIAGGEGWHSGHTHNQVGGALAMGRGVQLLPYRSREDAWISAWELLVAGPARRGEPPPPVYLLVNEGAHSLTREHRGGERERVAMVDAQQWAPFVVERAWLLEMFVHALTPTRDQLPTRVVRHELRMALLRLRVDEQALAGLERLDFGTPAEPRTPAGVEVRGGLHDDGSTCVGPDRPLRLRVPVELDEAGHLALVAEVESRHMARQIPRWQIHVDGQPLGVEPPPGLRPRPRATLGPLALPARKTAGDTLEIEIRGVALEGVAAGDPRCPHGRLRELRLLPRERGGLFELPPDHRVTLQIAPEDDLGHPIVASRWVPGRALSRYRLGTRPRPETVGFALVIPAGEGLDFAPVDLPLGPEGSARELDLTLTLARTHTPAGAALRVYADDELLTEVEVPAMRAGSWITPPIPWTPARDRARFRVELDSPSGSVELRDLALFVAEI